MAVSFDLFGTLVSVDRTADPAAAVAAELRERGVAVPDDWADAYAEVHVDAPSGAEVPLPAHVAAALRSRGVDVPANAARRAVVAAFDPEVETRPGAADAVAAARERGPVGLLSNCSVPELVARTTIRAAFDRDAFDATVTSVACGWRKPHPESFRTLANRLGVAPESVVHVGDDSETDGGVEAVGGRFVDVSDVSLESLAARLREGGDPCP
ncbi:haloacid dehalogenase superfamily, subfamily IA, variant 1 with third motif having Dx(3-4)D or Dx(3-4)E [Halopelagius inordinatus]|uniref:Haloacid dehalogenase superfamily, subfamily IA, variant 1 with third motif having Dx(3-4)D or Dx(3-4)E n=1 Tax=Halopelagius inordinatus TaxID=553467 RepID=A0A1I2MDK6_9EURY|nr:HAD family hydrolase [Halopelagius inordinatus]SFF89000.1 haloacid dehalogenase superfamily, subfamily IA, variant 1 with third motif having Dx(3-4)D or Dx(3-4)E [Halopelagius inordinatus]